MQLEKNRTWNKKGPLGIPSTSSPPSPKILCVEWQAEARVRLTIARIRYASDLCDR